MFKITVKLFALLFLASCAGTVVTPEITTTELSDHVSYLASDELAGRFPGTEGDMAAAQYIKEQFIAAGLELMGNDGLQKFEMVADVTAGTTNSIELEGVTAELGVDYTPFPFSANAQINAELVFAGFGFDEATEEVTWNDYQNIDVTGKWVLVLRGDPDLAKRKSNFEAVASDRSKTIAAHDKGAAGIILVNGPKFDKSDKLIDLKGGRGEMKAQIPAIQVSRDIADKLLAFSGKTVEALEKTTIEAYKPNNFLVNTTVNITTEVNFVKITTQNVVGMLSVPNADTTKGYIVIGAHYDHLGMGGKGSGSRLLDSLGVHNGADDNASGTAMVIELAAKLAANKQNLKRNVIFMAFGAEEQGLLGSKYFVDNALVPVKEIHAMFNFDMLGRLDTATRAISVGGTGTAAEFNTILDKNGAEHPFELAYSTAGYGPSDHAAFYAADIPVLYFSTGAHSDYHTPADDTELINFAEMEKIGAMVVEIITEVTNTEVLTYTEAGPKVRKGGRNGLKVTFGIMPAFADTSNKGLRVDGVTPNKPAQIAGMLKGDVIVMINDMQVTNIHDYMMRLKKLKLGDRITVDVMRGENIKVLIVQL